MLPANPITRHPKTWLKLGLTPVVALPLEVAARGAQVSRPWGTWYKSAAVTALPRAPWLHPIIALQASRKDASRTVSLSAHRN